MVNLSIVVIFIAFCSNLNEAPVLVSAFVQENYRPSSIDRKTAVPTDHIRQLPVLNRCIPATQLFAKPSKSDKDARENERSGLGSFFKGNNEKEMEEDSEDEEGKAKALPIVGRFFSTDEEKEERKRMKKIEKEEKELRKRQAKAERKRREGDKKFKNYDDDFDSENDKTRKIIPNVKNYFRERQIRKDGEALRFQVRRMEEERQKQLKKDADELRKAVQLQELERNLQFPIGQKKKQIKLPTAPLTAVPPGSTIAKDDIVRRKIQIQKELDQKRKERQEKINAARQTTKANTKPVSDNDANKQSSGQDELDSKSSKSQRFGSVVSAAQKLVSGVFDSKNEEWIVVAPKTRISPGEIVAVTAGGIDLLLIASKDGSAVHCVANSCPHLGTPLEVGTLERLPIEQSVPQTPSFPSINSGPDENVKPVEKKQSKSKSFFQENDIASMLKQDGCEDCIVCPLHKTAFALESGEVRGEWCPYPPVIGKLTGAVKKQSNLPVFDVRTKGKNIEVRLNTPVEINDETSKENNKR